MAIGPTFAAEMAGDSPRSLPQPVAEPADAGGEAVETGVDHRAHELTARVIDHARTFEEQKRRTYSGDIAMVKLLTAVIVVPTSVTS